jgi:cytidine deaminase
VNALTSEQQALVAAARAVRERAYAPYSAFKVGAALRTASGQLFSGCNVENASYGGTICAERSAVLAMVSSTARPASASVKWRPSVSEIAVFTDAAELAMPCGLCRQVLAEFERDAWVIVANPRTQRVMRFAELFPEPFRLDRESGEP